MSIIQLREWKDIINRVLDQADSHGDDCQCPRFETKDQFVTALEKIAKEKFREDNTQALIISLEKHHKNIHSLAEAVGEKSGDETLQATLIVETVWRLRFIVFAHGAEKDLELKTLVNCVVDLESKVPIFPGVSESASWGHIAHLQLALQKLVTRLFESYIHIINLIDADHGESIEAKVKSYFTESYRIFEKQYDSYMNSRTAIGEYINATGASTGPQQARYHVEKQLGEGGFGTVYRVKDLRSTSEPQEVLALKRIKYGSGSSQVTHFRDVENEIATMKNLHHRHITKLAEILRADGWVDLIIHPLGAYDLGKLLQDKERRSTSSPTKDKLFTWFGCLAAAMNYAHTEQIMHRDVKPENIIVTESGDVFLTDFGLARNFAGMTSRTNGQTIRGTEKYLAPECQPGMQRDSKVDVFALGCVFAEMLMFQYGVTSIQFDELRLEAIQKISQSEDDESADGLAGSTMFRSCPNEVVDLLDAQEKQRRKQDSKGTPQQDMKAKRRKIRDVIEFMLIAEVVQRYDSERVHNLLRLDGLICRGCKRY